MTIWTEKNVMIHPTRKKVFIDLTFDTFDAGNYSSTNDWLSFSNSIQIRNMCLFLFRDSPNLKILLLLILDLLLFRSKKSKFEFRLISNLS